VSSLRRASPPAPRSRACRASPRATAAGWSQAWQHKASLAKVQTSTIFVAGLISITLLLAAPLLVASMKRYVDIAASILAACLSLANAWIKFARYEQLYRG